MRNLLYKLGAGALVAALAVLVACVQQNDAASRFDPTLGKHPANWLQTHYIDYTKAPSQCQSCHGSTTDPAKAGGISKVSCFSCHSKGVTHPSDWRYGTQHGRNGAMLGATPHTGFASCLKCHGVKPGSGLTPTTCTACHQTAPHPAKPWYGTAGGGHSATDADNAPVCHTCHANGNNSSLKPTTPAPAGTAPGCFNNTMCHSRNF